jgi:AP endonuclease-2
MLDAMDAEIICFQGEPTSVHVPSSCCYTRSRLVSTSNGSEHKGRRDNIDKPTAVPPHFDAFFSFPHGKGGYSGTCTYVKSSYAVPLKAEEGITGKLLKTPGGNSALSKLVYEDREMIGAYVGEDEVEVRDNTDGTVFDVKRLDMEGRAVVLDFG